MSNLLPLNLDEQALKKMTPKIDLLEKMWLNQEQASCPVVHRFAPGICVREVKIPANTYAIGHHQNFVHLNILLKGRVSIRNDDGTFTELTAPMVFVGKPGRKIGFIHEDMTWLNIYHTNETDVEKIENHFVTKSQAFSEMKEHHNKALLLKSGIDQADFIKFLEDNDLDEHDLKVSKVDMMELPNDTTKFKVGTSRIHDRGLIATADLKNGELIGVARVGKKRTIIGRFVNHSRTPNAKVVVGGDDIFLIAITKINGQHGGMDGDEITVNYRDSNSLIGD